MKYKKETIINRYNRIMNSVCCEHLTIGERLSEDTEGWNVADMVNACAYVLSGYYECGHANCELREEDYSVWKSETGKLSRFIKTFKEYCRSEHIKPTSKYCSYTDVL